MQTEAGKRMPLDPEPVDNGNIVKTGSVSTMVRGRIVPTTTVRALHKDEPSPPAQQQRFVSHYATCPKGPSFRKNQPKGA